VDWTRRHGRSGTAILVLALVATLSGITHAQVNSVTTAEIQRLQDSVYDASRDVAQLRARDATLAAQLQGELDDARDEAIYLKVKLRKNETITRNEYLDLRDQIDRIRSRARGDVAAASTRTAPAARDDRPAVRDDRPSSTSGVADSNADIPVGTEFDVRLQTHLNSGTAMVEDRFEATTLVDYRRGNRVIVPAGSMMRGVVSSVKKAGRLERTGSLTLAFDRITTNGRSFPIRATVVEALESEGIRGEAGKIGTAAGVGAVIGAIIGGAKGALAGILIGAGGTIAATEGKDVDLPVGTVLRVRMDTALNLR
jgi:hypothetical protein